ncbi:hypothetical protein V8G54_016144 [Vigna mungo]|uniref:Uncharacterized protein n=1 Tax=Vigna mungo TaxID=3915 RepID=A0AAQ3S127_VIGMU
MKLRNFSCIVSMTQCLVLCITSHGKFLLNPLKLLSSGEKRSHIQSMLVPHTLQLFLPFHFLRLNSFDSSLFQLNGSELLNLGILLGSLLSHHCLHEFLICFLSHSLRFFQLINRFCLLFFSLNQLFLCFL